MEEINCGAVLDAMRRCIDTPKACDGCPYDDGGNLCYTRMLEDARNAMEQMVQERERAGGKRLSPSPVRQETVERFRRYAGEVRETTATVAELAGQDSLMAGMARRRETLILEVLEVLERGCACE